MQRIVAFFKRNYNPSKILTFKGNIKTIIVFFFHNLLVDIYFFLNWNDSVNRDDENPKTNLENFAVIKNVHFKSNKGISDESPPLGTKIELLYHVVAISTIYLTKRRGLQTKIDVILIIWDEIEKVKYENVFTYIHT